MAEPAKASADWAAGLEPLLDRRQGEPAWLLARRREAVRHFSDLGWPNQRLEAWRFTDVGSAAAAALTPARPAPVDAAAVAPWLIYGAHHLVFVNGHHAPALSSDSALPDGIVVSTSARLLDRDPGLIEPWLARLADGGGSPIAALNTALHHEAAVVALQRGAVVDRPIHLLFVSVGGAEQRASFPRVLVIAEEASTATVVETHVGSGAYLSCPVTEINLSAHAELDHYRILEEAGEATHIAVQHSHQHGRSTFRSHAVTLGGGLARADINAVLAGEGAHASLSGLKVLCGREHADSSLRVHHTVSGCTSRQLYKSILAGRSRSVFTGRIVVDPGAQKTNAEQSNRNLLLSESALARSNPQLEILADDVRCTHGSTVGQLDEEAIFYLRSRGIGRDQAVGILTRAFAAEVVDGIRIPGLRSAIATTLRSRLALADEVNG